MREGVFAVVVFGRGLEYVLRMNAVRDDSDPRGVDWSKRGTLLLLWLLLVLLTASASAPTLSGVDGPRASWGRWYQENSGVPS